MDLKKLIVILNRKVLWYRTEAIAGGHDEANAAYYRAKAEAYADALYFVTKLAGVPATK